VLLADSPEAEIQRLRRYLQVFARLIFWLASERYREQPDPHEELRENSAVDSGRGNVRHLFRGGQTKLQKERQEVPDERQ
jgi:hypothetical protein